MKLENKTINYKLGLLKLAIELNNVSLACKIFGCSRPTYYRYYSKVTFAKPISIKKQLLQLICCEIKLFHFLRKMACSEYLPIEAPNTVAIFTATNINYSSQIRASNIHAQSPSPQTNSICERFNRTMKDEFYYVELARNMYSSREKLEQDIYIYLHYYNKKRVHSDKYYYKNMPQKTFLDNVELAKNHYIDKVYKMEDVENEKDDYILRYPVFYVR